MNTLKIALTLMLVLVGSCAKGPESNPCSLNTRQQPVTLLAGEQSFSPYEKYAHLRSNSTFRKIEGTGRLDPSGRSAERFELRGRFLGHPGRLEYVFYFGKLAQTRFHPDDPDRFFQNAKRRGLPAEVGGELVAGDVAYWATGQREKAQTFGVSDIRITRSFLACIGATD